MAPACYLNWHEWVMAPEGSRRGIYVRGELIQAPYPAARSVGATWSRSLSLPV